MRGLKPVPIRRMLVSVLAVAVFHTQPFNSGPNNHAEVSK